ncbi:MAG: tripartite tricarboxylate transporter substrate binding protein [Proteobacteria bacterium]|nr:tripartite tricarboxylate transporter substrate binding protein [Pseudomonadota bacterium]
MCLALAAAAQAVAPPAAGARCIAPAKPGGGFDLTCQLLNQLLLATGELGQPLPIVYQPGGIGALAFKSSVSQRPADGRALVAFSSGTLLNLAQGRFGPYDERSVRWLAGLGMDYGVIAVRQDAPYRTLAELLAALRAQPGRLVFGGGGSIGSQDWMKAALLARAAGVSHKEMRFVAFEGGGEALAALMGDHVQVLPGDAAEVARQMDKGAPIRVLALLAPQRLPGRWSGTPTAREQGLAIDWPILRGLYLGPGVGERDYRHWADMLGRAMRQPAAAQALAQFGLQPVALSGAALDAAVQRQMQAYRQMAQEFGVMR